MSDSPSLPPHDAFDQIADVFLTDPLEGNDARARKDARDQKGTLIEPPRSRPVESLGINTWTAPPLSLAGGSMAPTTTSDSYAASNTKSGAKPHSESGVDFVEGDCSESHPPEAHHDDLITDCAQVLPSNTSILLACHLPVQGRLWLNQIAELVARTHGATCFIRIDSENTVAAELFGSADLDSVSELPQSGRTLAEAIRQVAPPLGHYLIHVERLAEIATLSLAREPAPARIILATSVDPAALVGVYRTLKDLVPIIHDDTEIELILVGTAPETAKAAFGRISAATTGFLKRAVVLRGIIQRIKPIIMTHLGDFECKDVMEGSDAESAPPLVSWVCNEISASLDAAAGSAVPSRVATSTPPVPRPVSDQNRTPTTKLTPTPIITTIPIPEPTPFEAVAMAEARSAPATGAPVSASALATAETRPPLVSLVRGLTDLVARSPKGPAVELAVDNSGGVHALYQDSADQNPHDALIRLQSVCEWIEKNALMITLLRTYPVEADSAKRSSSLAPPQAHLFTDRPQKYRALMDGSLRIHLLARNRDLLISNREEEPLFDQAGAADARWIQVAIN